MIYVHMYVDTHVYRCNVRDALKFCHPLEFQQVKGHTCTYCMKGAFGGVEVRSILERDQGNGVGIV